MSEAIELVIDPEKVDEFSIPLFAAMVGWSETKVRSKIRRSWVYGKEFFKNPDGDIMISWSGYKSWSRKNTPALVITETGSDSPSTGRALDIDQPSLGAKRRKTTKRPVSYILKSRG